MKRFLPFLLLLNSFGSLANEATTAIRLNPQGVAIDGYSPVSYFVNEKAEVGSPEFSADHAGATYWFTDAAQVELFEQDPEQYLPAHGGWCSLMLSGSGNRTAANPESWTMVDGQLLLFWSGTFNDMEINGLSNWGSKTQGKAKKESKRLKDANKTWAAIVDGKKKGQIVLFNETDGERMSAAQLESAKRSF